MNNIDFTSVALAVDLDISRWNARRFDRRETQRLNTQQGTRAARVTKELFDVSSCQSYKDLNTFLNAAYQRHIELTLPWTGGLRILPVAGFDGYKTEFGVDDTAGTLQLQLQNFLYTFLLDYPAVRANAQTYLNGMYNEDDYPSVEDLRNRFAIRTTYFPMPSAMSEKLDAGARQMLDSQLQKTIESAVSSAVSEAWQRLYDCTARIQERLSQPGAIFRDSLIENARECCLALKTLNFTGDAALEAMRAKVESELAKYDPDTIRNNPYLRNQIAASADTVMTAIRGTRKIRIIDAAKTESAA